MTALPPPLLTEFFSPPFGPLNGLHRHIVEHSVGFTPLGVALYLGPLVFVYAQCYLLLDKSDTRYQRMALGVGAFSAMWSAWTTIRFADPWRVPMNHMSTMPYIHYMGKTIEFALLREPIRDPHPRRSRAVSAWGLFINSRLLGLGDLGLDDMSGIPNTTTVGLPERQFRLLVAEAAAGWRPKSRFLATLRHALYFFACYTFVDTLFHLFPLLDPVFDQPYGGTNVFWTFTARQFIALPSTLRLAVPHFIAVLSTQGVLGSAIWAILEGTYQLGATVHVLLGWPVSEWDLDLMASPAECSSLIEFWGARWHSTFRHFFVNLSKILLGLLHLPTDDKMYIFIATFLFSGLHHGISEIAMPTAGQPVAVVIFFLLSGLGCSLELTFKRMTGRLVGGIPGRIWTVAFMAATGLFSVPAWLDTGYGACHLTQDGGPGEYLARWIYEHVLKVE